MGNLRNRLDSFEGCFLISFCVLRHRDSMLTCWTSCLLSRECWVDGDELYRREEGINDDGDSDRDSEEAFCYFG